jgi:hypothetical protein
MTVPRLFAVLFIFASTAVAWFILGASVATRTNQSRIEGGQQVASLWGGQHDQAAPTVTQHRLREISEEVTEDDESGNEATRTIKKQQRYGVPLDLESSSIDVRLGADHRRKGLLWYDTYTVDYRAEYSVRIPDAVAESVSVDFRFPSASAIYDDFSLLIDGEDGSEVVNLEDGVSAWFLPQPGRVVKIEVRYRSRGFDTWAYRFGGPSGGRVSDFDLTMKTDFGGIDFPPEALSPSSKTATGEGWRLEWSFDDLVSGRHVGVDVPNKLNPGPLAARITFFAPVSLLFFITVLVILGALGRLELHPMHFFFLSASFFSFHLLLAYLADQINVHLAFVAASVVSLALTLSYLRLVCGLKRALRYAGSAQLIFLVLFSYAFFFQGLTGLAITIGSIVTLFVLMQLTAEVDWNGVFRSGRAAPIPARPASA